MPEFSSSASTDGVSNPYRTHTYSLLRLYPEIHIGGNTDQNAPKYYFEPGSNNKRVIYRRQLWYSRFKGVNAETAINKGDMLAYFAGIHNGDRVTELEKEVMN